MLLSERVLAERTGCRVARIPPATARADEHRHRPSVPRTPRSTEASSARPGLRDKPSLISQLDAAHIRRKA